MGVDHGVGRVARLFEPLATVLAENRYHSLIRTRKNVFWKKGTRQNRSRIASGESFPGATRPSICLVPCYADFAADLRTGKTSVANHPTVCISSEGATSPPGPTMIKLGVTRVGSRVSRHIVGFANFLGHCAILGTHPGSRTAGHS